MDPGLPAPEGMTMDEDQYAAEEAVIERELTEAQFLEFDDYAGFLAHYGARIWEFRRHDYREAAPPGA